MPVGLQTFNDSGLYQIDGSSPNIALVKKQTVRFAPGTSANATSSFWYATVSVSAGDIVAFSCSTLAPVPFYQYGGGYRICVDGTGKGSAANHSVTFYVFRHHTPAPGSFGYQLFDTAGQLVFDATWKLFKPVGIISSLGPSSNNFPTGKTYAAFYMCVRAISVRSGPTLENFISGTGISISGRVATWDSWTGTPFSTGSSYYGTGRSIEESRCVIIDVTNY